LPLEDFHQEDRTNWTAFVICAFLIALSGALGALIPSPYGWLVASALGIIVLFAGMKMQQPKFVKTFSRTITSGANIALSSHAEGKVTKAAEKKDADSKLALQDETQSRSD
jgi:uncharacterized membrane protein AbrB (regulator of aidB expression)